MNTDSKFTNLCAGQGNLPSAIMKSKEVEQGPSLYIDANIPELEEVEAGTDLMIHCIAKLTAVREEEGMRSYILEIRGISVDPPEQEIEEEEPDYKETKDMTQKQLMEELLKRA